MWQVERKDDLPWACNKLLKVRNDIRPLICCKIGDGRRVSLFYDQWLDIGPLHQLMQNDMKNWGDTLKVRDWWDQISGWCIPRSFSRKYPVISNHIHVIQLTEEADKFLWKLTKSGNFSVFSCYNHIRICKPKVNWYRIVWNSFTPPKYSFIVWLAMQDRLKTKVMLSIRGVQSDMKCVFCDEVDYGKHLLFECAMAEGGLQRQE